MSDEALPLSEEERAELEALRAERDARKQAAREREELEALRAQGGRPAARRPVASGASRRAEAAEDARIREARERGARLMEPDEDLRMPVGQKVVLGVLVALVVLVVAFSLLIQ